MKRERLGGEIFLISLAMVLAEISFTRIFSFKLVYYFTYLIIGTAMLGLGAGAILAVMFPRLRGMRPERLLPTVCGIGGLSLLASYLLVATTQLNASDLVTAVGTGEGAVVLGEGAKLGLLCLALFAPFAVAGFAIATILATGAERIHRLYFADLLGAGVGCALAVPLMQAISPPGCVWLAGALFAAAGLRLARNARGLGISLAALAGFALLGAVHPERIPDPVVDRTKSMSPQKNPTVHFSRWSPVFRVDVVDSVFGDEIGKMLSHDGMWGSVLPRFDGDVASLSRYDGSTRLFPFRLLPPAPRVAIIGAAGGNEILASLFLGAGHVTAVELNPVTVSLLTDHFVEFTGDLARHERVTLVNGEGRSFLQAAPGTFDLLWLVAPDTYAAMNAATSGAFVLSESYLYTDRMILEGLRHLSEDGILCTQFGEIDFHRKPNRTLRYLATARQGFRRFGVDDFAGHVLVANSPGFGFAMSTILLKRTPFTAEQIQRFVETTSEIEGARVRYARGRPDGDARLERIVAGSPEQIAVWSETYPFEVGPVTDDAPFFWHFVPFRTALGPLDHHGRLGAEEGMGERLLMILLVTASLLGALLLGAPLAARRAVWRSIPHKVPAAVFFASLGLGFMFIEVSLIQRLTLFLGYPTYSLTVTLFALLVSTGFGSLWSERFRMGHRRLLPRLAIALGLGLLFCGVALPSLAQHCIAWPLVVRIGLAIAVLTPLGVVLGVFMPLGLRTLAGLTTHGEEYLAWGWAVNGFFSVTSSVLATALAMTFGFDLVLVLALVTYGVGIAAFLRVPEPLL